MNDDYIQFDNIFQDIQSKKPDLFLIEYVKCFILKVSCLFDAFIEDCTSSSRSTNVSVISSPFVGLTVKSSCLVLGYLDMFTTGFAVGWKISVSQTILPRPLRTKYAYVSVMINNNIVWKLHYKLMKGD